MVYRTEQMVVIEARVYLDCNDLADNFIANAFAQKYLTEDAQFGNKFLELAETAAVVISIGFHKGKTLGQVAVEKPSSLEWYVTSYGGPDNLWSVSEAGSGSFNRKVEELLF